MRLLRRLRVSFDAYKDLCLLSAKGSHWSGLPVMLPKLAVCFELED